MTVTEVLHEAFDLYERFLWRFVATAAVPYLRLARLAALDPANPSHG